MYLHTFITHKNWQITFFLCLLTCLTAGTQTVENIRDSFDQSRQVMLIYYDLKGLNFKQEIEIVPQFTSGNVKISPSERHLAGDFGWVNKNGKNKVIVWDPFAAGINSLRDFRVFIIRPNLRKAALPSFVGVAIHGSNSAPFGLKFMTLGRNGFFLSFRKSKSAPSYDYGVSNTGEIDYQESGVYRIGNKRRLSSYAITAGKTFRLSRHIFGYAGLGYGAERLFWNYEAYNLDGVSLGSYWALNENINRKGIAADLGVATRIYPGFLIDLGVSTINFTSFQIIGGIGLAVNFIFTRSDKAPRVSY